LYRDEGGKLGKQSLKAGLTFDPTKGMDTLLTKHTLSMQQWFRQDKAYRWNHSMNWQSSQGS
jgi:hypothetical protein